jgi:hypothetical protein
MGGRFAVVAIDVEEGGRFVQIDNHDALVSIFEQFEPSHRANRSSGAI